MFYIASILMCVMDQPAAPENCYVFQSPIKHEAHDECWMAVTSHIKGRFYFPFEDYRPRWADCHYWNPQDLDMLDELEEELESGVI